MEIERAPHDKNRSTKDKRGSDILQPVGETFTFQILIRTPCKHTHTHTHTKPIQTEQLYHEREAECSEVASRKIRERTCSSVA